MAVDTGKPAGNTLKRVLLTGIGIITLGIVIWSISGYPPKDTDVQGTIGTAEKYRATQITDSDVKLDNSAIHSLLQNDAVVALLKNDHFRKAVNDVNFRDAITS